MESKLAQRLEASLLGGVVFYVLFRAIALFAGIVGHELVALASGGIIAGAVTGYELRNHLLNVFDILFSAITGVVFFALIQVILGAFSRTPFASVAYFWILYGLLSIPLFFAGEALTYHLARRRPNRNL